MERDWCFGTTQIFIQIPVSPVISCETMGKTPHLSKIVVRIK